MMPAYEVYEQRNYKYVRYHSNEHHLSVISYKFTEGTQSSKLDHDECTSNNGGCDQVCVNEHATHRCECYTGYQLGTDGKSCAGKHPI
jgi:fibulin 1/2